jgi:hypothetical protein
MSKELFLKQNLKKGEVYAGLILGIDDQPDEHVALLPNISAHKLNWNNFEDWRQEVGGSVLTRQCQSLLFTNCKKHFEAGWYWSSEQVAANPDYAWMQVFDDGDQYYNHQSNKYRARAVRRFSIIK